MTANPSAEANSTLRSLLLSSDPEKERQALWCLVGFLLEQVGGSIVLSSIDAINIFDIHRTGTGKKVEIFEIRDPWSFTFKVVNDD